jgi:hypothetical protein
MNLVRKRLGLYMLCESVTGGFTASELIRQLITDFGGSSRRDEEECVVKFLQKLEKFARQFLDPVELFQQQFDESRSEYRAAFTDPFNILGLSPPKSETQKLAAKVIQDSSPLMPAPEFASELGYSHQSQRQELPPLLIIFDEAHALGNGLMGKLKVALDQFNILGVFLSTCGHLNQLQPSSMSDRSSGWEATPPICNLFTTDLYEGHKFTLGRPLWHHYLKSRCGNDLNRLVTYALYRLSGNLMDSSSESFRLSLFMCRFGGLYPIDYSVSSDFVKMHLATFTSFGVRAVEEDDSVSKSAKTKRRERTGSVSYPSEPVLAEASALCTSGLEASDASLAICSKEIVLETVKQQLRVSASLVKTSKGDVGEFLACALIGYQLDYIRVAKIQAKNAGYDANNEQYNMSSPVPLTEFLAALFEESILDENLISLLDGYMLNTTHFVRLPYKTAYSTCARAIERGAGVITYECSRSLEFYMEAFRPIQGDLAQEDIFAASQPPSSGQNASADRGVDVEYVGSYQGRALYKNNRRYYYVEDDERIYVNSRSPNIYRNSTVGSEVTTNSSCSRSSSSPSSSSLQQERKKPLRAYDNIHVRVSVKNYTNEITRGQARKLINAADVKCEPVNAVGGGGPEKVRVTLLINVGRGILEPFVHVDSGPIRPQRSKPASEQPVHISLALGLNYGDATNYEPFDRPYFKYFSSECLRLFREAADGHTTNSEKQIVMSLGRCFGDDRNECLGI